MRPLCKPTGVRRKIDWKSGIQTSNRKTYSYTRVQSCSETLAIGMVIIPIQVRYTKQCSIEWTDPSATKSWPVSLAYASPETRDTFKGDCASDVWGLGMVYIDMLYYLTSAIDPLRLRYKGQDVNKTPSSILARLLEIRSAGANEDIVDLVGMMLAWGSAERPTANQVVHRFQHITKDQPQWCGSCCLAHLTEDNASREGMQNLVT
jgi:serine/threonine protein kinase